MHTFLLKEKVYEIGYYKTQNEPGGGPWQRWMPLATTTTPELACDLVNYLNGGHSDINYANYKFNV